MANNINTPQRKKLDKENRDVLLSLMRKHELTGVQVAEITGYSIDAVRCYTMSDRSSNRASMVNDRFIKMLVLSLNSYPKKS